jgi:hypothetical protein
MDDSWEKPGTTGPMMSRDLTLLLEWAVEGKPVVRVKNILGDDVYGLWHVEKIVVHKGGQRYALIPHKETFGTKDEAEHYAYLRTRRFVERKLGGDNNNTFRWRAGIKYLFTVVFISVMTAVAIKWFRNLDSKVDR